MPFSLPVIASSQKWSIFVTVCALFLITMNAISINCANDCKDYKESHPNSFNYSVLSLVVSIILCLGGIASFFIGGNPFSKALSFFRSV